MMRTTPLPGLVLLSVLIVAACRPAAPAQAPTTTQVPTPSTTTQVPTPSVTPPPQEPLTLTFQCQDLPKEGFPPVTTTRGRVCVSTLPGADLMIEVSYCTLEPSPVPDQSPALQGPFQADSRGYYEWNWRPQAPQATCLTQQGGTYTSGVATVTSRLDGQTITKSVGYQVD